MYDNLIQLLTQNQFLELKQFSFNLMTFLRPLLENDSITEYLLYKRIP